MTRIKIVYSIKGAFYGLLISLIFNFALSTSSTLFAQPPISKTFSTSGCDTNSSSTVYWNQTTNASTPYPLVSDFNWKIVFQLSYLWYSLLAVFNVFLIGILVSCFTGLTNIETLDENLYYDVLKRFKKSNRVSNSLFCKKFFNFVYLFYCFG
jgi:hypothetical protein